MRVHFSIMTGFGLLRTLQEPSAQRHGAVSRIQAAKRQLQLETMSR